MTRSWLSLSAMAVPLFTVFAAGCTTASDHAINVATHEDSAHVVDSNLPNRDGADPVWVGTNYLDQRLYGKPVPDYFYVCGGNTVWAPAGIDDSTPPPFANEQDGVLDIRSYDPETFEVTDAKDPRYKVVQVNTQGFERAERRTFILGPQEGGFCIGQLSPEAG